MDSVGLLDLSWAQGYNGSPVLYIDEGVYCFVCGKNIKFVSEDGSEKLFAFPGRGLGPLALHPAHKHFAVASQCSRPKIHIYQYPTFEEVSILEGGAALGYSHLAFSSSNYLLSISTLPDFLMSLWLYTTGEKVANVNLNHFTPTSVSFNPVDWRQICLTSEKELTVWEVEQCDLHYTFKPRQVGIVSADAALGTNTLPVEHDNPTRASTRMTAFTVDVPKAAKAGLVGSIAERLDELQDDTKKVVPVSHSWVPNGDVYVGCEGGQLLLIDGESWSCTVLYNPLLSTSSLQSREPSNISLKSPQEELGKHISESSLACMKLHRRGLYVAGNDGVVRLVNVNNDSVSVLDHSYVGVPVTCMDFSPSFDKMVLGSSQGIISLYQPDSEVSIKEQCDLHYSQMIGLGLLASGGDTCVTLREDGELQFWNLETGSLTGAMPVGIQCTSLAVSPMCHCVAIGTASGHIYVADCTELSNVRLVYRNRLFNGAVKHLKFQTYGLAGSNQILPLHYTDKVTQYNNNTRHSHGSSHCAAAQADSLFTLFDQLGNFIFTAADEGEVFVLEGRASENFKVLGYTDVSGYIRNISLYSEPKKGDLRAVVACSTSSTAVGATKIFSFEISEALRNDMSSAVGSLKGEFKPGLIKKLECVVKMPVYGVALTVEGALYTIGQDKKIQRYTIPSEIMNRKALIELSVEEEYSGHELPGGTISISPHQQWLTSCAADGSVIIRSLHEMSKVVRVQPGSFTTGGVQTILYSDDCTRLVALGHDSTLTCYKWHFSPEGVNRAKSALESSRARRSRLLQRQQEQDGVLKEIADWCPSPISSRPSSARLRKEKEVQDKEKAVAADEIYTTPTPTAGSNATWLECREIEAHKEEDKEYTAEKNDLRLQIRDMRRTIQAMMKTNEVLPDLEKLSHHEFDLDIDEQIRLQGEGEALIHKIREEIEFENLALMYLRERIKKECWDDMEVKGRAILAFNSKLEVSNFPMKTRSKEALRMLDMVTKRRSVEMMDLVARRELAEAGRKPNSPAEDEGIEMEDSENQSMDQPSLTGSLGAHYGGENPLLMSQFELHTREQKLSQVILLEDSIHRIKKAFNKEFEEGFSKKEQEIAKIKEKNKRIVKILEELDLNEECVEPEFQCIEKPELLLTVEDEEVKIERFLTPDQKKEKKKQEKLDEERRLKEKGDNVRERALGMMMGGVLEIKKEEELKKDIPVPAFMSTKGQDDWTEEENKLAKEYEKKVKDLEEEREKYRKQLESELRKLQAAIQEGMASYDEALNLLFMRKVRTQMVIYQEELKMLRLRYSLLIEEELELRENELNRLLEQKRAAKQVASQSVQESKIQVDQFKESYDTLDAEDKLMEKSFKKEFSDCTALQVEQLLKLFKKRPRGQKLKGDTPVLDPNAANPFAERPSTARKEGQVRAALEAFLEEADRESNMPENVEPHIWERMCKFRREKVNSEQLVKSKRYVLSEMTAYLHQRQEDEDTLKGEIDEIMQQISRVKEDQLRFTCNLEVQLMLKQGQVEIDPGSFIPDFTDSVLLHRNVVEDLNTNIKQLGESKIASMVESKDFRKGILQLEWEHKRMLMLIEDLNNKMKDIQFMKVTREIQLFLTEADYDAKKGQEVGILEQTLQLIQKHHDRKVKEKKRTVRDLNNTIRQKQGDNIGLSQRLEELNVSLNERIHIDQVNADQRLDTGAEKRYREIVQRRKLVDLAKAQAQEVAVLRAEVERLRMRTFPALVQVER